MSTVRIQIRRGTAAQWTSANPTLAAGEMGVESDTRKTKIGTGSTAWTALAYANVVPSDLTNTLSDYLLVEDRGVANGVASLDAQGQVPINQLGNVIDAAPGVLDTLNELAAAINDDASFVTTINTSIATKLALAGGTMTGVIAMGNNKITGLGTPTSDYDASTKKYADDLQTQTVAGIATHASVSTNVHGVADMAALATMNYVNTEITAHNNDTTSVHGITDTAQLASLTYVDGAVGSEATARGAAVTAEANARGAAIEAETTARAAAISAAATTAATNLQTHTSSTTSVHGISDTSILATTTGAETLSNKTLQTPIINAPEITATAGTPRIHGIYLPAPHGIIFEGTTANDFEATLTAGEPTADHTVTLPDASGTLQLRVADVSDTEIGYLNGVTSAIQAQIDAKAPSEAPTFTGTVTSTNDLVVDGNLTVNGTTFNASATSITIEDNLVQLAHQNAANTVDLGLVVAYNDGAAKHSGLVRDVSEDEWKLFKGVTSEPTTTVNFGQGSLDNLELNNLVAAGVVFTDGTQTKEGVASRTPIVQKTASYTLSALTERDSLIEVANSTETTITIPTDATLNFPIGTSLDILQTSTGQVTIAGADGVTVNATPGLKLRTTWSSATLFKRAENTWVVYGDLKA